MNGRLGERREKWNTKSGEKIRGGGGGSGTWTAGILYYAVHCSEKGERRKGGGTLKDG